MDAWRLPTHALSSSNVPYASILKSSLPMRTSKQAGAPIVSCACVMRMLQATTDGPSAAFLGVLWPMDLDNTPS